MHGCVHAHTTLTHKIKGAQYDKVSTAWSCKKHPQPQAIPDTNSLVAPAPDWEPGALPTNAGSEEALLSVPQNTEVLLASRSHPCPFFFHKSPLSPWLPDNGLHNSYLLWMEIKLSSMQFLPLIFLGNLRWSFPTELNFINPEKHSVESTFCTRGRGK